MLSRVHYWLQRWFYYWLSIIDYITPSQTWLIKRDSCIFVKSRIIFTLVPTKRELLLLPQESEGKTRKNTNSTAEGFLLHKNWLPPEGDAWDGEIGKAYDIAISCTWSRCWCTLDHWSAAKILKGSLGSKREQGNGDSLPLEIWLTPWRTTQTSTICFLMPSQRLWRWLSSLRPTPSRALWSPYRCS